MRGLLLIAFGLCWALCRYAQIPNCGDMVTNEAVRVLLASIGAVCMVAATESLRTKTFPRDDAKVD